MATARCGPRAPAAGRVKGCGRSGHQRSAPGDIGPALAPDLGQPAPVHRFQLGRPWPTILSLRVLSRRVPALTTTSYGARPARLRPGPPTSWPRRWSQPGWIWPRASTALRGAEEAGRRRAGRQPSRGDRQAAQHRLQITRRAARRWPRWLAEPGTGHGAGVRGAGEDRLRRPGHPRGPAGHLAALIDDTTAKLRFGDMIARQYLDGLGRSPSGCRSAA